MIIKTVLAAALSVSLLGVAAAPAYANLSRGDCLYALKLLKQGAGDTRLRFNEFAQTVQACHEQGVL